MELEANLGTEEAYRAYLARLRWPDGFAVHVAVVDNHGMCEQCCLSARVAAAKLR